MTGSVKPRWFLKTTNNKLVLGKSIAQFGFPNDNYIQFVIYYNASIVAMEFIFR